MSALGICFGFAALRVRPRWAHHSVRLGIGVGFTLGSLGYARVGAAQTRPATPLCVPGTQVCASLDAHGAVQINANGRGQVGPNGASASGQANANGSAAVIALPDAAALVSAAAAETTAAAEEDVEAAAVL